MQISTRKGRSVTAQEDGDRILVIERERLVVTWTEDRIMLTREEIAKLAQLFPVSTADKTS